jgi:serine/threonine-protein kinase
MGLHHSNLVEVLDLGEAQGRYFLVLELVDGWTLQQLLERSTAAKVPVPPAMALYVCAEVCRALSYAHHRTRGGTPLNIVHRDVCPNNVLVSETGEVKLTDFGIAKARTRTRQTAVGTVAGKPSYMSPEQACGETLDARSDLFSVGTLLYYLLTAQLPFRAPNDRELMVRVASGEFVSPAKLNPALPKGVVKVVLKAMARDRGERFQSAQEMLTALEKMQREELEPFARTELEAFLRALTKADGRVPLTRESMVQAPPHEEWIELSSQELEALKEPQPKPKKRPWVLPVASAVAMVLLGAAGDLVWQRVRRPPRPRPPPIVAMVPLKEVPPLAVAPPPAPHVVAEQDAGVAATADASELAVAEVDSGAAAPALVEAAPPPPPPLPEPPPAPPPEPVAVSPPPMVPAKSAVRDPATLRVSIRVAPPPKDPMPKDRANVQFDSDPSGAAVMVDRRTLGTTPVALRFKMGVTFQVTFERDGFKPNVQWLTLVERPDRPPKVSLQPPPRR